MWDKLFSKKQSSQPASGSQASSPPPPTSRTATSPADATHVDPRSITHIILIVDKSEPITNVRDMPNAVFDVWQQANPAMSRVLAGNIGIPCYYVEAARTDSNGQIGREHLMGAHLSQLYVPEEHSVFVQLLTIRFGGVMRDITLETVFRTKERRCIISEKPLIPDVA